MALCRSGVGPVNTFCNMVSRKTAVANKPNVAITVTAGATAKLPLKIKNSAAKPAMNGNPSEQNVRIKNAAANRGVTELNPPKSPSPRDPVRFSSKPAK